ncbi:UNVERIFIED_CONTAM: hypothetical protein HDU68_001041 [Siphonaria sp. JEL0065]|nr:hypothetical protein HDU68_001041 [Siphonaria sp. JEL0065]
MSLGAKRSAHRHRLATAAKAMVKGVRDRFNDALTQNLFPPVLVKPDDSFGCRPAELFCRPYMVWCPESVLEGQRPGCQRPNCGCSPNILHYKMRLVQDIHHTTEIIYVEYECSKLKKDKRVAAKGTDIEETEDKTGRSFNTLASSFLESLVDSQISKALPYILTLKAGFSKHFVVEIIDTFIRSSTGLTHGVKACEQYRSSRYYHLLEIFAARSRKMRVDNPDCLLPTPIEIGRYLQDHDIPDSKTLTNFWLEYTKDYEWAAKLLMETAEVRAKICVDGTCSFAKRMRVYVTRRSIGPNGRPVVLRECRMVLVLLNEIGQVLHICFIRSENHVEIEAAFQSVYDINIKNMSVNSIFDDLNLDEDEMEIVEDSAEEPVDGALPLLQGPEEVIVSSELKARLFAEHTPQFPDLDSTQIGTICCDNLTSYRTPLKSVFGTRYRLTQDPRHFMQRLVTKIKLEIRREFAGQLSRAVYASARHLWERELMFRHVRDLIKATPQDQISSSQSEWENTCANCLMHIYLGDLSPISSNVYVENGIERSLIETSTI